MSRAIEDGWSLQGGVCVTLLVAAHYCNIYGNVKDKFMYSQAMTKVAIGEPKCLAEII